MHDHAPDCAICGPKPEATPEDALTAHRLLAASAQAFGWRVDDLTGSSRTPGMVHARHIAMYLVRARTSLSLPQIGRLFGGRDHTTVLHAVRKIANKVIAEDIGTRNAIALVDRQLA